MTFIPIVNMHHTQLLTSENWLSIGVTNLAFSLASLLIKPGFSILMQQVSLADFVGWPKEVCLVSRFLLDEASDSLVLRSPFDGSMIRHSREEIEQLVRVLKPTQMINEDSPRVSEAPLKHALEGNVVVGFETLSLTHTAYRDQFIPIEEGCACPTCEQKLTRAYLHHLWFEVPLLCQRYLAMHNVWLSKEKSQSQ